VNLSLERSGTFWELKMTEVCSYSPDELWPVLTTPAGISLWMPFEVLVLEPKAGGQMTVRFPEGDSGKGVITDWQPEESFGFRIYAEHDVPGDRDTVMRIATDSIEFGTTIACTQLVGTPHIAPMVALGWVACLGAIYSAVKGVAFTPFPPEVREFEEFVQQLHLDEAVLEPIPGGTRIKFDRQTLMQPVEKFWSVMTAGIPLRLGDFAPPTFTSSGESGRISILTPPSELEYLTSDGGRVKWRFHEHFGSTRVNLQIAVPRSVDAEALATTWQEHLGAIVSRVIAAD